MLQIDTDILVFINSLNSSAFDNFFFNASNRFVWIPLYAALAFLLFRQLGYKQAIISIISIALCILLADQLSSGLLKPLVARLRPSHDPQLQQVLHIVNGYRGGLYGFPSSHAANTAAISLFLILIFRSYQTAIPLVLYTLINCYSRMYLAVHYPLDILVGLVIGSAVAVGIFLLQQYIIRKLPSTKKAEPSNPAISKLSIFQSYLPLLTFLITLPFLFL